MVCSDQRQCFRGVAIETENKAVNPPVSTVQGTEYAPFCREACNTHCRYRSSKVHHIAVNRRCSRTAAIITGFFTRHLDVFSSSLRFPRTRENTLVHFRLTIVNVTAAG